MNPLTNVKNITKLNEIELASGLIHKKSWHDMYKESAWIFIGGLEYGLTEGDIITVFSQYGEVVNINLVRDKKTGKSKGFSFLCYANQKSTVLAVDNLNGIKLCNRTIRVDHVANYKPPKENERDDEVTKMLKSEGCAPKAFVKKESDVVSNTSNQAKKKKSKKEKKEKKKKKRKHNSDESDSGNPNSNVANVEIKKEKFDAGYDKYDTSLNRIEGSAGRRKYQERDEESLGESSHLHGKFRSKSDQQHETVSKNHWYTEDKYAHKHKEKVRSDRSLQRKIKREKSSSSSDDNSKIYKDNHRQELERSSLRRKHSESKTKQREAKCNSSSSSDDESSSQSFSDDERHENESRNSVRDKYKNYNEETLYHKERGNKCGHKSKNTDYTSSKRHYDITEKDSEHRSKSKYDKDRQYDSHHRDSYHKSKYDKR